MKKVILFGSTGYLGKEIAKELVATGYAVTCVARSEHKAGDLAGIGCEIAVADVTRPETLANLLAGFDVVISSLGKSVSLNDRSKPSFYDVDFIANSHVLNEAMKNAIPKFVYVSAFHSERYLHLEYFRVHHEFSQLLQKSGLDYSIVKPPALFSAFLDLIPMAKKGQLVNLGKGEKKTNPIFEGDLARIVVASINTPNCVIEAGGKEVVTRKQIMEIIQAKVNPGKHIPTVPLGMVKTIVPLLKWMNRNAFDKMAFFLEVMQHDTVAPQVGDRKLEHYIEEKIGGEKTNK